MQSSSTRPGFFKIPVPNYQNGGARREKSGGRAARYCHVYMEKQTERPVSPWMGWISLATRYSKDRFAEAIDMLPLLWQCGLKILRWPFTAAINFNLT